MITPDVKLGEGTLVFHPELVNLYGCTIGKNCKIASFVEIQKGVVLGDNVKVEAFAFIPTGVTIEDGVFIGPHACLTNDKYPKAVGPDGKLLGPGEWTVVPTVIKKGASIGAGATILCGITIGENAVVAAGAVVTKDVPPNTTTLGV
jgi:acetyltransferase-like isoleucine patch superfamily enzyme